MDESFNLPAYQVEEILTALDDSQRLGWGIVKYGIQSLWGPCREGQGVTVAVIDSGCDLDHPDLKDNLLPGRNFLDSELSADDDLGHGTHCASILGAVNNAFGIAGVAPKCKILPLKALNKFGAAHSKPIVEAIEYATAANVDFICMSLGTRNSVQSITDAIQKAYDAGIVCFCASGNDGGEVLFPANLKTTVGVGALDENGIKADFSNVGDNVLLSAPGISIYGAWLHGSYATLSGTSQATPFIAGVAALILARARLTDPKAKLSQADLVKGIRIELKDG